MFDKQGRGFRHRTIKTSRKIEIYIIIIHITTAYLIETQKTTTNFLTVVKNCCARLTDGRYLHHPAGVSFRLLPCGRRSTRNRCSSLLRFEADENISPSGAECAIYANSYNNDMLSNLDASAQASVLFLFPLYGHQHPLKPTNARARLAGRA